MRFPRTNLTDAGEFSTEVETQPSEEFVGERPELPVWQSNFRLAPNVRFTRTPEALLPKRRQTEAPAMVAEIIDDAAAEVDCPKAPSGRLIEVPDIIETADEPISIDVPFDVFAEEGPIAVIAAASAAGHEEQPLRQGLPYIHEVFDISSIEAVMPIPVPEPSQAEHGFSALSDFAFWEAMAFEGGEAAFPAASSPQQLKRSPFYVSPETIVRHFRVMEWRSGGSADAPAPRHMEILPSAIVEAALAAMPEQQEKQVEVAPPPVIAEEQTVEVSAPEPVIEIAAPVRTVSARPPQNAFRSHQLPPVMRGEVTASGYEFPPLSLLQQAPERSAEIMTQEMLEQNAGLLESVLEDFGIKGEIIHVRPGPVVTLYEFEPAPGVKSSRVIGLADDIARSMSAISARVAVVPGRNVIGIELPNATRETVYFREMIESDDFRTSGYKLALGLGKTIGGEPVIAELAKMPHLLVAGTTGSGKSVAINTMILSLLYRMTPEQCRLIMVDPKMLELSVYDGIPHLLTPVVTDPKKAVMALKWAVREMEDRYRKMSRLGVRNIDGYNARLAQARDSGEVLRILVQTGFDKGTGAPIEEEQDLDLAPMPYIVVIVDEMADLMMVAGKEIEGAIQRLAQMARAAGIHLIMATQRPSVDVITGTIKANFPTRISFQVTSKIDSRTILGEQGAEQLLGQGDMLHMQGGGRIARVHGPFVSDAEVEKVVAHLKTQGRPEYLETVTADEEDEGDVEDTAVFDKSDMGAEDGDDLYDKAIKVVMRDKKCSTSYIQRRLGIGYNRAASLVERMEKEGLVGPANHVGKREIVAGRGAEV
ncbi:DNA translocase FtsK [Oryzifoliimicrobium ureilyticus]|uniref:DNA translocase FtsK n=1 Tax=Oryzifoliimicrobium ureilyticus TaxID=3113724 RepID=UPI00307610C4